MRRLVLTSLAATLVGITTLAFAQAERHVKADFTPFASAGLSGTVDLFEQPRGGATSVKVLVKGLEPGVEYFATWYTNSSCTVEATSDQQIIGRFTANPAGNANMVGRLNKDINEIGSVSIRLGSDRSLQGCATIPQ